jgi:hypothetical protein
MTCISDKIRHSCAHEVNWYKEGVLGPMSKALILYGDSRATNPLKST